MDQEDALLEAKIFFENIFTCFMAERWPLICLWRFGRVRLMEDNDDKILQLNEKVFEEKIYFETMVINYD